MAKDIVVVVKVDAKPATSEALDILFVNTSGAKAAKVYRDLESIKTDYPGSGGAESSVYNKAAALFNQGKTTLSDTLIGKVKIVGIDAPAGETEDAKAAALVEAIETYRSTDDDWYILLTDTTDDSSVKALCSWAEATEPTEAELNSGVEDHRKIYFGQTNNKTLTVTNRRSVVIYTDKLDEHADAAYLGNVGGDYPDAVTWKFKRPQGLTVPVLTEGEKEALEEANINFLTTEYKREYIKNGVCTDGEYIDVQLGADYIARTMRENLYDVFLTNKKVPYTDEGFSLVGGAVYKALNSATSFGIIARDADSGAGIYSVSIPRREDATEEETKARIMPDITWEAVLEGSVHKATVTGTLRAALNA